MNKRWSYLTSGVAGDYIDYKNWKAFTNSTHLVKLLQPALQVHNKFLNILLHLRVIYYQLIDNKVINYFSSALSKLSKLLQWVKKS